LGLSAWRRALRKSTNHPQLSARDRGDRARDLRHWADAASHYREHVQRNPGDFAIWVQLGHCLKEAGHKGDALKAYNSALAINGQDEDLLLHLRALSDQIAQAASKAKAAASARRYPDIQQSSTDMLARYLHLDASPRGIAESVALRLPPGDKVNLAGLAPVETALLNNLIASCAARRRALDINAHVGARSLLLAQRFVSVEAFEPHGPSHSCLMENVRSTRVTKRRVGVHAKMGTGFTPTANGEDSANTHVHLEKLKNTTRVPLVAIDDFGWSDVDLIVISRSADWIEVIAGAWETIQRSLPVIAVRQRDRNQPVPEIMDKFGKLFDAGYRVEEIDATGFVMRFRDAAMSMAEPAQAALISGDLLRDHHLVLSTADVEQLPSTSAGHALIGDTFLPTTSGVLGMTSGIVRLHDLAIKPPFSIAGHVTATLPNGRSANLDTVVEQELAILSDAVELTLSASGGRVSIPPSLAAITSHLSIKLTGHDDITTPIFDRKISQLRMIDAIDFTWPLNSVKPGAYPVTLQLYRDGEVICQIDREFDFSQNHIHRDIVNCYLNHGGGGNDAIAALASSLKCRSFYAEDGHKPGASVVWGVLRGSKDVIDTAIARGDIFYYVDHAYFARGHKSHYRMTRNRFDAGAVRQCPNDRLAELNVDLHPWNEGGRSIIVCPPTDYFMHAHDCHSWLDDTLAELRKHTDRPIVIREKKGSAPLEPLAEALADAHALVTHSSNVAVEAAVLGTPVFVSDASAARPVGLSDLSLIETPAHPPRKPWLAHLAYSQFSFEEMQSGKVWRLLEEFEQRSFVA